MGLDVLEKATHSGATATGARVSELLSALPVRDTLRWQLDEAIGEHLAATERTAFLAGVEVGRNPWGWLVVDGE